MAGLVVLGLLTVVAGVLSGRSTINYVLARDAREAALSWAGDINKSLSELGPHAPQLLDQSLEVLDADKFASQSGKLASLPASSTSKDDFTLFEDLGRLTTGWLLGQFSQSQSEFVSKLDGFAVLGADQAPLAGGGNLSPATLEGLLAQGDVMAAIAQSAAEDRVVTTAVPGRDGNFRLAFVPATEDGKVARATPLPSTSRPLPRSPISPSPWLP
jgi:hypothetical protein